MRAFAIFIGLIALGLAGIAILGYPAWLVISPWLDNPKFHRISSRIGRWDSALPAACVGVKFAAGPASAGVVRSSVEEILTTCFGPEILEFGTKQRWPKIFPQTTPVPLRDRCRCAAHPLLISGGKPEKRPFRGAVLGLAST
jgi:hypothetical protein